MTRPYSGSFGPLARDANGSVLQTAMRFGTKDATATPKASPLTYDTTITTLTVPPDAVQLVVGPSTALRVSDDPAMGSYDVIAAGAREALPVTSMSTVYVRGDTAGGTLNFRFAKV